MGLLNKLLGLVSRGERERQAIDACRSGDLKELKRLLLRGVGPNAVDHDGSSLLHIAARSKDWPMVRAILDAGADLGSRDAAGATPLHRASATAGGAADLLIGRGADVNARDAEDSVPLQYAVAAGVTTNVKLLLQAGADIAATDRAGMKPIHTASMLGTAASVKLLVTAGADPGAPDRDGNAPLHLAAGRDAPTVVRELLAAGASVDALNLLQETPLLRAAAQGSANSIKTLTAHGAYVNVRDAHGSTALHRAVQAGSGAAVAALLAAKPDLLAETKDGKTALALAQEAGQRRLVKLLQHPSTLAEQTADDDPGACQSNVAATAESAAELGKKRKGKAKTAPSELEHASIATVGQPGAPILAVYCTDLRYDPQTWPGRPPQAFVRAQAAWVRSGNNPSSTHYAMACRLLTPCFESRYRGGVFIRGALRLNEDNEIAGLSSLDSTPDLDPEVAFADEPQLLRAEVVAVDFRDSVSQRAVSPRDVLVASPAVGIVAIFTVMRGRQFAHDEDFIGWLNAIEGALTERFSIAIADEMLRADAQDEDGDGSTSSSWSGGDLTVVARRVVPGEDVVADLTKRVHEARRVTSLVGVGADPVKELIVLGDEDGLRRRLDDGLAVDARVGDLSLLAATLGGVVISSRLFESEELHESLASRHGTAENYASALKGIAHMLLDQGASVVEAGGMASPIALATAIGDQALLTKCLARSASTGATGDPAGSALLLAAENGDVETVEALLSQGARVNKRELLHELSPLIIAAQGPGGEDAPPLTGSGLERQLRVCQVLIDHGAKLDATDFYGDCALINAARRGHTAIVDLLIKNGADRTVKSRDGETLLGVAKARGHNDVVALLRS